MYKVLLTTFVDSNKKNEDGVLESEKSIKIMADRYKSLKTGWIKFYLNNVEVSAISCSHVIGIIQE